MGAVTRDFSFQYGAEVGELPRGKQVRVWFPIPQSGPHQSIQSARFDVPGVLQISRETRYDNQIGYFQASVPETGRLSFSVTYRVQRKVASAYGQGQPLTNAEKSIFLAANARVPVDGRPVELLAYRQIPSDRLPAGRVLYDLVYEHMQYDKSQPGYGQGDAVWACDHRKGNCTDFHSLFISLARSQSIAARFEIGFPLPADQTSGNIPGYHCWAWFHSDNAGWFPVDISEADKHPDMKAFYFGNLTADRLSLTTGRDIELVPAPDSGPLNYFIYPHVEVDGKVLDTKKIRPQFSFVDIPESTRESTRENARENARGQ